MIATWMLYASLLGLFASLAAHALDRAARANGLPSRFIWLAAMIATLFAPVAGYWARESANGVAVAGVTSGQPTAAARSSLTVAPEPSAMSRTVTWLSMSAAKIDNRLVALIWVALTLILLGRLAFATGMLWRRRAEWTAREIDGVHLFITPNLGPAVVTLPRPEILMPEWLLSLDAGHISMVLRHEGEHRAAGDHRLLVAATVLTALVPWNPALWWQMRRLRLAVEMDCDARVLRADPRIDRYGSLLLAIAQHPRAALYSAATLTESTSDLERRIDAMTRTPSTAPRITAAALGALAVAAMFAACVLPSPDLIVAPTDRQPAAMAADDPMFDFQVEHAAKQDPGNSPPLYPTQLRAAGVGGVVIAKFVVDTTGRVDMRTFEMIKSDHDLFTNSVRQSLPDMRFVPAEVGGRRVKQLVQMPFIFALSSGEYREQKVEFVQLSRKAMEGTLTPDSRSGMVRPRRTGEVTVDGKRLPADVKEGNRPPMYPTQLRAANIEGQVVARFLVRSDGSVDMATYEIVMADHPLFANSVKNAVATYRFSPTKINGRAVDRVMTMPFAFSLSK